MWNAKLYLHERSEEYAASRQIRSTKAHAQLEAFIIAVRKCIAPLELGDALPTEVLTRLRTHYHRHFARVRILSLLAKFGACGLHPETVQMFRALPVLNREDHEIYQRWRERGNPADLNDFLALLNRARNLRHTETTSDTISHTLTDRTTDTTHHNPDTWPTKQTHGQPTDTDTDTDMAHMDVNTAARFCFVQSKPSKRRIDLLLAAGCRVDESALIRRIETLRALHIQASNLATKLHFTSSTRFHTVPLYVELGLRVSSSSSLDQLVLHGACEEVWSAIRGLGQYYSYVMKLVAARALELGRPSGELSDFLEARLHAKLTGQTMRERARALSSWHKSLYDEIDHVERRNPRIAHIQRSIRMYMYRFSRFLLAINHYSITNANTVELKTRIMEVKGMEEVKTKTSSTTTTTEYKDNNDDNPNNANNPNNRNNLNHPPDNPELPLQLFLRHASVEQLRQAICWFLRTCRVRNDRVKSQHNSHHAASYTAYILRILRLLQSHIGCDVSLLTKKSVLAEIPNERTAADVMRRRVYSEAEMDAMRRSTLDPCEALLFALLQEVALRSSALGHLRYEDLLTPEHTPRCQCRVVEKGGIVRTFTLSLNVQAKIKSVSDFLRGRTHEEEGNGNDTDTDTFLQGAYVLNPSRLRYPLSLAALRAKVRRIAERAGVKDIVVYPHAFRHTLVNTLINAGNSLDLVAKFIGHQDARTTSYFYWVPTAAELERNMINPFSPNFHSKHKRKREQQEQQEQQEAETNTTNTAIATATANTLLNVANKKLRVCRTIIDLFRDAADFRALETVREHMPNLEDILSTIDIDVNDGNDVNEVNDVNEGNEVGETRDINHLNHNNHNVDHCNSPNISDSISENFV